MADEPNDPGAPAGDDPKDPPAQDAEFYKAEAKKAFRQRDEVKRKLRELEEAGLTADAAEEYKQLKAAQAQAEEDRKKRAGEFDSLRADLAKKHEEALKAEQTRTSAAVERLHGVLKDHAFASAHDWFGGADAKTILTPDIAAAYFGKYVKVEVDEDTNAERVVVYGPDGHRILDAKTGKPAAFSVAIGELIQALPTRDNILRGSGKAGSGSSGGADRGRGPVDLNRPLKQQDFADPKVRDALHRQHNTAGGLQIGPAFDRARPAS